ncbi:hypothetical protein HAX54_033723 [Datura stramonium]|uniref:Uncharacterized protein n=1 Tax=Datura stramonium TaxID=4076 RepID=A0ABS8VFV0_DATST|nr:hypothetical protein [Datura stramonium]
MSTNQQSHTGQASVPTPTPQEIQIQGMEDFYRTFKEKRVIHAEESFDVESFRSSTTTIEAEDRTAFHTRHQFGFEGRRLMPSRNTSEVPIEVVILLACIMKHVCTLMGEIIADQLREKLNNKPQHFTSFLVSMLCLRVECHLWCSLDKTIQAHGVITLDTKTDKEAQMIKGARYTGHMTPPSPADISSHIATASATASAPPISTSDLLIA